MYLSSSRTGPAFAHAGMAYPGTSLACSHDHLHPQNLNAGQPAFTRHKQTEMQQASAITLSRCILKLELDYTNAAWSIPTILCEVPLCDVHNTQPLASQRLSMHTGVWKLSQARCCNHQHVVTLCTGAASLYNHSNHHKFHQNLLLWMLLCRFFDAAGDASLD